MAESEAATGRVSAREQVCAALVRAGFAVRHGRAGHQAVYLTQDGLRLRGELLRAAVAAEPGPAAGEGGAAKPPRDGEAGGGGFTADDGSGAVVPGAGRQREVAAAWAGLVEIRRVLGDGRTELPAGWEAERPVHAVALALEAHGVPPARAGSPGYLVAESAHPGLTGLTEVAWSEAGSAAASLARIAELLPRLGWQATAHRTRAGVSFLLASPRQR